MKNDLQEVIDQLSDNEDFANICGENEANLPLPSIGTLSEIVQRARALLFPGYFETDTPDSVELNVEKLEKLLTQQIERVCCVDDSFSRNLAEEKAFRFIRNLPEIRKKLHTDVVATYTGDPAAKSYAEVIFCYPAIRAMSNYRIANALLKLKIPLIPRIISEMAHSETGIDIHPGATIGEYFTIDHGTGVVIGETSVIGDHVKIYQGVTLGAKSFPLDENGNPIKGIDRHPKIGNHVIIYSNSTILGNIKIGDGAIIGGNIWVDRDVPDGAKLVQKK